VPSLRGENGFTVLGLSRANILGRSVHGPPAAAVSIAGSFIPLG
jgi:hypothetical protein